jgi:hypothetical protein
VKPFEAVPDVFMSFNTFVSLLKLKHVALNVALAKSVP